jgi:hypothetical protein
MPWPISLDKLTKKHEQALPKIKAEYDTAILLASQKIQQEMLTQLQPIFELFGLTLSSKATPGDKYLAELQSLQAGLSQVQARQLAASGGSNAPMAGGAAPSRGVTWGMGSMNLTPPLLAVQPTTPSVAATGASTFVTGKITNLDESIKNIEAQLVAERVELGGVNFALRAAAKAWLKIEAPSDMAYVFFLDPHSFMNVGYSGVGDSAGQLGLQAAAAKAGFASSEEALVVSSYKFELPTFFGKETKDSRKLPVVPTTNAGDSKDGFTGVRYKFRKLIHSTRKEQLGNANLYLTGDGLSVA